MQVPEGFSLSAMQGLLLYLYTDQLPPGLEPAAVVELLHAAAYYSTPRWDHTPKACEACACCAVKGCWCCAWSAT
jgi:hypothetical protein